MVSQPITVFSRRHERRTQGGGERNRARRKKERKREEEEARGNRKTLFEYRSSAEFQRARYERYAAPPFRSSRGFHVNKFLLTTYTSFPSETRSDMKQRGRFAGVIHGAHFLGEGEGTITREIRKRYIITPLVRSLSLSLSARKFTSHAWGC